MRCSIARVAVALALLSVAAITGCQSGGVWDPLVLNPFHTTSNPPPSSFYSSAGMTPTTPSSLANSPGNGYNGGPTASGVQ